MTFSLSRVEKPEARATRSRVNLRNGFPERETTAFHMEYTRILECARCGKGKRALVSTGCLMLLQESPQLPRFFPASYVDSFPSRFRSTLFPEWAQLRYRQGRGARRRKARRSAFSVQRNCSGLRSEKTTRYGEFCLRRKYTPPRFNR